MTLGPEQMILSTDVARRLRIDTALTHRHGTDTSFMLSAKLVPMKAASRVTLSSMLAKMLPL
jgi:hypothetical protein